MKQHGDDLNFDILSEMEVLQRNIKEALRMNPPLIMLMRYCKAPFAVTTRSGKEYVIPKVGACHLSACLPAQCSIAVHDQTGAYSSCTAGQHAFIHCGQQPTSLMGYVDMF